MYENLGPWKEKLNDVFELTYPNQKLMTNLSPENEQKISLAIHRFQEKQSRDAMTNENALQKLSPTSLPQ